MNNKEIIPVKVKGNSSIEELLVTQNYISPLVNIYENDDEFVLTAFMPGVVRDNVKVKVEADSLIMFGQIDYENEISRDYILNEQEIANYYRTFKISDTVDKSKIEARYDNGQLVVNLQKKEKAKPRRIDIL
ncbi:MAG: Hsp20/alpha crystallin family protein [Ignavibacteria bacterium]|nr:MAG: Hsp20/alpha crystallin family protein [Ignavibacteria bacterium]